MTTLKSSFVIRHSPRTVLSLRRVNYVMTPHLRLRHPVLHRQPRRHFIHYLYNGLARTYNEGTQYSTNSTSVIITTAACSSTPGMPVTGLRSLHNTRNTAHSQTRLHQIPHIISMVP